MSPSEGERKGTFEDLVSREIRILVGGEELWLRPPTVAGSVRMTRFLRNCVKITGDKSVLDSIMDSGDEMIADMIVLVLEDSNPGMKFTRAQIMDSRINIISFVRQTANLYGIEEAIDFIKSLVEKAEAAGLGMEKMRQMAGRARTSS